MADEKFPQDEPQADATNAGRVAGELFDEQAADGGALQGEATRTDQEVNDLKDKYLRLAAEFENYKRCSRKA